MKFSPQDLWINPHVLDWKVGDMGFLGGSRDLQGTLGCMLYPGFTV